MKIFRTKREIQDFALAAKRRGRTIGLVPTMGYLHAGHTSLIDIARGRADVVIVSIFVNPTQFGPNEDLDRYPRDFEHDLKLCDAHGADAIFAPEPREMYDADASTWVTETMLSRPLCGASRPTFFRGVTTVVSKLFLLAQPDFAVFGLKDAQQLFVVRRMVRDLCFPVEIVAAPLVRDSDGLALSSRNRYLSADERTRALGIHRTLLKCKSELLARGLAAASEILDAGKADLADVGGRVDYLEVLDASDLEPVDADTREVLLAAAVFFGSTRLIDNELFEVGS